MSLSQIAEGTINNLLNLKEDLYLKRIKICRECFLYKKHPTFGEICDNTKFIDNVTGNTSQVYRKGFIKGCGCFLNSKCRVLEAKCPASKW